MNESESRDSVEVVNERRRLSRMSIVLLIISVIAVVGAVVDHEFGLLGFSRGQRLLLFVIAIASHVTSGLVLYLAGRGKEVRDDVIGIVAIIVLIALTN